MSECYTARAGKIVIETLEKNADLSVIAVHSESVYARREDGRLLLLCPDKYGSVPFGISVGEYSRLRASHVFREGDLIRVTDGGLVLSDGCVLSFDFDRTLGCCSEPISSLPNNDVVSYCADYVRAHASIRGIGPALPAFLCIGTPREESNVYALSAAGEADRFEAALASGDNASLGRAVGRFVGLGYGLTPSGDDFLCGMLYALHRFSCISDRAENYLGMLSAAISEHMEATNEVSAEYIRCALDGEYFEVVERVLDRLTDELTDTVSLDSALGGLLSVGASSGSDILCGILFAVYLLW